MCSKVKREREMQMEDLYAVRKRDLPRAVAVLTDAFKEDPVWRKALEGIGRAEQRMSALYESPLRYCLAYGSVYAPTPALEGVAAWMPGERANMSLGRMLRSGGWIAGMRMGLKFTRRMMPMFRLIEEDRKTHMKGKRFVYLQIIGVATALQGHGYGSRMLRALVDACDRSGRSLYLETETIRNVELYQRYGFVVLKEFTAPVLGVPMWEMRRDPAQ
jgi:ribosomal protein S18 acetylase RimI-like enzyme